MTSSSGNNYHKGLIRSIKHGTLEIGVEPPVSCTSCELSTACELSDKDEKIIFVKHQSSFFNVGDQVDLVYNDKQGSRAIFLVYIIPLFVLILAYLLSRSFTNNELIIGLNMLLSLPFYFLLFKLFNRKISDAFSFRVMDPKKEENE